MKKRLLILLAVCMLSVPAFAGYEIKWESGPGHTEVFIANSVVFNRSHIVFDYDGGLYDVFGYTSYLNISSFYQELNPVGISFADFSGNAISDLSIPTTFDFTAFGYNRLDVNVVTEQGSWWIEGEINSVTAAAAVPEPATMLLLGTGLVGVAGAARRKKKNQA